MVTTSYAEKRENLKRLSSVIFKKIPETASVSHEAVLKTLIRILKNDATLLPAMEVANMKLRKRPSELPIPNLDMLGDMVRENCSTYMNVFKHTDELVRDLPLIIKELTNLESKSFTENDKPKENKE